MGPPVQCATEQPDAPYEIRLYPGADAKFTIYEDDNETYNYEQGQRATCDLVWNDAARTLTLDSRRGSFPGMVVARDLKFVLAAPAGTPAAAKTVRYTGDPIEVKLSR
jgi:alpha-D-xyloside xylohydrolase